MRKPTKVTKNSITAESASIRRAKSIERLASRPPVVWPNPAGIHVNNRLTCTAAVPTDAAQSMMAANAAIIASPEPVSATAAVVRRDHPLRLPTRPLTAAPIRGRSGISQSRSCLLYTSDAADEEDSVDLG